LADRARCKLGQRLFEFRRDLALRHLPQIAASGECRLKCRSRTCPGSRSTKAIVAINLKPAFPHTEDCRFSTVGGIERDPRAGERRCRPGRPAV
jgi:hypothetical protein